jgi:pyridoxal phosphate enzyme (YggS family)
MMQLATLTEMTQRVSTVRSRIADACAAAGRDESEITLVAASKTRTADEVLLALEAGIANFGENRPEEAASKISEVNTLAQSRGLPPPSWHMIGHVQGRKARLVVGPYCLIHSLDSYSLAARLDRLAAAQGIVLPVLLEVNTSEEPNKYGLPGPSGDGLPARAFLAALDAILPLGNLRLLGLMTMAAPVPVSSQARPYFRKLFLLREWLRQHYRNVEWQHLSMGMSDDYDAAIAEGATIVRIGRAIFGERRVA